MGTALRYTPGTHAQEPINGGLFVIEPKGEIGKKYLKDLQDLIRESDFRDWIPGACWRGSGWGCFPPNIHNGVPVFGGRTVQGLLPYYFLAYLPQVESITSESTVLSRCKYNNMDIGGCSPSENVTANHFAIGCMKPWVCHAFMSKAPRVDSPKCKEYLRRFATMYMRVSEMMHANLLRVVPKQENHTQTMFARSSLSLSKMENYYQTIFQFIGESSEIG